MSGFAAAECRYECCICFESLHIAPVCALAVGNPPRRVCRHTFHDSCVKGTSRCPLCRAAFESTLLMPDPIECPTRWFEFMDSNNDGSLSMEEILHGLNCALPLDPRRIRQDSEQLWRSWDSDGDNAIQLPEFLNRKEGLLGYLLTTYGRNDAEQPVPPLSQATVRDWFQYWDEDSSGSLSKDELVRAVVKTLRLEAVHDVSALRSVIEAVWFLFDSDGNGVIDLGEFLATDGLADTLLATLQSS